jgi:hypothetical protein
VIIILAEFTGSQPTAESSDTVPTVDISPIATLGPLPVMPTPIPTEVEITPIPTPSPTQIFVDTGDVNQYDDTSIQQYMNLIYSFMLFFVIVFACGYFYRSYYLTPFSYKSR